MFEGNIEVTGSLTVQGNNINELTRRIQAVEGLPQQVNNFQQQLESLQQDVQEIANRLITLSQRVTALGG